MVMIVATSRIAAAGVVLPPLKTSNSKICPARVTARHGISEQTDAGDSGLEETGNISIADQGNLQSGVVLTLLIPYSQMAGIRRASELWGAAAVCVFLALMQK